MSSFYLLTHSSSPVHIVIHWLVVLVWVALLHSAINFL